MDESRQDDPRYRAVTERIGEAGSVEHIATPALVCELDSLKHNIDRMADLTAAANVGLRPHVKSHKSAYLARMQLEAGAVGLACAKLSEAEAIVERLRRDGYYWRVSVLITSPLVGTALARRACALAAHCELLLVVEDVEDVNELAQAAISNNVRLGVLCDVDVGQGRTGVDDPSSALRVVERIASSPALRFAGVQGYAGQLQHMANRDRRRAATVEANQRLGAVTSALESRGYDVALRTGGGTGSCVIDMELGQLNELQCGSYVFMDRDYRDALGDDLEGQFHQSLHIVTTVLSTNRNRRVTVDAGLKAMATDAGSPLVVDHEGTADYRFFGDEHGSITISDKSTLRRGDRLRLVPPHCDPTVDRYDLIWMVRGDTVLGVADIVARGCSQ